MRLLFQLALVAAVFAGNPCRADTAARKACEAPIQKEIDQINAKMRSGYWNHEGERLRAKLRFLEEERYNCRKARRRT